eukprot:TRINITY_DN9217_c0_g1_i3.p1 TRINITY_DN9217_c0_g1~~TRINITY_DN9217_c0_g1_i3.p1  ORF type:complete len:166 (+),score=7.58 TRINITY_DN9217_c0_g1_i3:306-803(+)
MKDILREIKLMRFFNHDNIISLIDLIKPETMTDYKDVYIVTEVMETDLHQVIYSKQDLTYEHVQYFMYQILRGLYCMHSGNVIHGDLRPSSFLINRNCDLKFCDLQGCKEPREYMTEIAVTRWYRAPEMLLNPGKKMKASDIWSVGCIFAEIIRRTPLFPGNLLR